MSPDHQTQFLSAVRTALLDGTVTKLTLGKPRNPAAELRNIFIRPVTLKSGPHFSCVYRYANRDITKNYSAETALAEITQRLADDFFDAHLFTNTLQAQWEALPDGPGRLRLKTIKAPLAAPTPHDRTRRYSIPADAVWLRTLGVTNDRGQPREAMAGKFRQIQKFAELIATITTEAHMPTDRPWHVADMGCGKGYLTFALAALLGHRATITGIERRADLVEFCNRAAHDCGLLQLRFIVGDIGGSPTESIDLLVALHACDTATDDALAHGIACGARALVVSPCCQKELRPHLTASPVLVDALRHGIFQERQAEFATDALRAMLLEWAGYRTKVFEFISTEHTAKNLMITATFGSPKHDGALAERIRAFAHFYGIRTHALATHLHFPLHPAAASSTQTTQSTNS